MPRSVLMITLVLCLVAGAIGLRAGWHVATLTETDVIDAAVADYIAREAAQGRTVAETDCSARPGAQRIWVIVLCLPLSDTEARRVEYHFTRYGQMSRYFGG